MVGRKRARRHTWWYLLWTALLASAALFAVLPARAATDELDRANEVWLSEVFQEVEDLRGIRAEVRHGVVHLRGDALDEATAKRAVELARSREGVAYVDDAIVVDHGLGARVGLTWSRFGARARDMAARLPIYGVALLVVVLGAVVARQVRGSERRRRKNPLLRSIGRQVVGAAVFGAAVVLALDLLEATAVVGAVLGAAGVAGLAVGFAFKDIIENYLAGVLLALRHPFHPGDLVKIGDHEGKVVRLTSRDTVLMSLDGNHIRIPNADVFKRVTTNYTLNPFRRFWVDVGVGVNEDLTRAQHVALTALRDMAGVADDPPPFSRIEELGDWAVKLRVYGWADQREFDWYKVKSEATRRVKVAFDKAGIEMPFPTYVRDANARKPPPVAAEAPAHEVVTDDVLDAQVKADRAASGEEDLLSEAT